MQNSGNTKKIAINTIFLYARMLIVLIVSLYISRILLSALGVEDYGIYNIVGGVTALFSFMMSSMSVATQRFLNYELGKGNTHKMKSIFSTSIVIHFCIVFSFIILAETIGLFILKSYIAIPSGKEVTAFIVYQCTIITMCFHVMFIPYSATMIAYEKISIYASINIIDIFLKLAIALSILYIPFYKLSIYAGLLAIESCVILLIYYIYCKRKFIISTFHQKFAKDRTLFKELLSFTGWNFLGQSAMVLSNQGVNIVLNMFYGVIVNAAMGIATQVNGAVMNLVYNFQTAFRPQLTMYYAQNDEIRMKSLISFSAKISYFLIFIVSLPLILNMDFVLSIWLKNVPDYTNIFCSLILIYSLTEAITGPLFITISATGKIRDYQIIISFILFLNIVLSYFFLYIGYSPATVLIIKILVNIILLAYRIYYCNKVANIGVFNYLHEVVVRVIFLTIPPVVICTYLKVKFTYHFGVFSSSLLSIILVLISMYYIGFNTQEKSYINNLVCQKLLKKKN